MLPSVFTETCTAQKAVNPLNKTPKVWGGGKEFIPFYVC